MEITIELDAERVFATLERLSSGGVAARRREFIEAGTRTALSETVERTPVDEGEARGSWVAGLIAVGGSAPSGWEGSRAKSASIAEGSKRIRVQRVDGSVQTEIQCRNEVQHVTYLEYGTRKMEARAPVRRSLEETAEFLRNWEFLTAAMIG